jgi:hypothetical protein
VALFIFVSLINRQRVYPYDAFRIHPPQLPQCVAKILPNGYCVAVTRNNLVCRWIVGAPDVRQRFVWRYSIEIKRAKSALYLALPVWGWLDEEETNRTVCQGLAGIYSMSQVCTLKE